MRLSPGVLTLFLMLAAPATARATNEIPKVMETSVGEMLMLKLPGNPRAGYKWQLNPEKSRGLDLVTVDQIGWIMGPEGGSMFFTASSILNVRIQARAAGESDLVFDYYRTWGNISAIRSETVKVVVRPGNAGQ